MNPIGNRDKQNQKTTHKSLNGRMSCVLRKKVRLVLIDRTRDVRTDSLNFSTEFRNHSFSFLESVMLCINLAMLVASVACLYAGVSRMAWFRYTVKCFNEMF